LQKRIPRRITCQKRRPIPRQLHSASRYESIFIPGAAAAHLYASPLSKEQTIAEVGADYVIVTVTVRDTAQLEWWLFGFGRFVEVMQPTELCKLMISTIVSLIAIYVC
jgi:predicted DNA-binding transcriptional regulator YafY